MLEGLPTTIRASAPTKMDSLTYPYLFSETRYMSVQGISEMERNRTLLTMG
jgi:hypothetical protein